MSDNVQYTREVLQTQYEFALNQKFTDFKLRAGGKTVHCHRSVIAAKSEYFRSICDSGLTEAALDHSVTKAEDKDTLDSIVKFLYLGNADITEQNVVSLVLAADFIRHNELKKLCEEYMISKINVPNLMAYYQLSEKMHLSDLNKACYQFSLTHFSKVTSTEWYFSLSIKEMEEYLSDDALNVVSEDDVIDAILKWLQASRASPKGKEDYMKILMPCIRLEFCTKSKLEALSKDPDTMDKLRLRIFEYLHGVHRGQNARATYSAMSVPKATGTKSTTAAVKAAAGTAAESSPTAGQGEEKVLLLGGRTSKGVRCKDITYLDKEPQGSVVTHFQVYNFSMCASTESDSLIVSGGCDIATESSVPHVKKFNLTTKIWTDLPDMKHQLDGLGSTVAENKLFTIGGRYSAKGKLKHRTAAVNSLDLHTLMWSACPSLLHAVSVPGIAYIDMNIFVIGGDTDNGWSSQVCKFSTQTGKWIKCQNIPKADFVYRSTVVVYRNIFVLDRSSFLQYDVDIDQWHELPVPVKPSRAPAMVLKQGCLLALGGYEDDNSKPNDCIQTYDPSSKKWSLEKKKMPLPLVYHWVVTIKTP